MKVQLAALLFLISSGVAQTDGAVVPAISTGAIDNGEVKVLHLAPGYVTSVMVPEEISSVVIGDPAHFKAEHSEAEARLVFFKPVSSGANQTNALITTRSGHEISLHLVSSGEAAGNMQVDFLVEYRRPQALAIDSAKWDFLIGEARPIAAESATGTVPGDLDSDSVEKYLEIQKKLPIPSWTGKGLLAALGPSWKTRGRSIVGFSVLNSSATIVELLAPQLEITGTAHGREGKRITAEPIPISDYRMTGRRLQPGQRVDGVVVFERPAFKQSDDQIRLRLAEAEQVDRPLMLPVPFTPASEEADNEIQK
jgi:hypothetical protein